MGVALQKDIERILRTFPAGHTAWEIVTRINGELGRNYLLAEVEGDLRVLVERGLVRQFGDQYQWAQGAD